MKHKHCNATSPDLHISRKMTVNELKLHCAVMHHKSAWALSPHFT